jgi:isoamyl acetate esterase
MKICLNRPYIILRSITNPGMNIIFRPFPTSFFIFASLLLLSAIPAGFSQQRAKIIFFGDSITEAGVKTGGYIDMLNKKIAELKLADKYECKGSGIGGNKVYDLYLRLEKDVLIEKPDIVVIYIGVNDVWHKSMMGTGTDPDKFEVFYTAIIQQLKKEGIKVILCTPAVIGEKTDFSNQQDGDLNKYASIIRSIAVKNQLPVADLRKAFLDYNLQFNTGNKEYGILTTDRVHLNSKGNELVASEIWKEIVKL